MGLTRGEFWSRIGLQREIDPLTDASYKFAALLEREQPRWGHAHAQAWHVSFHGSSFPGEHACGRAALYTMMDFVKPVTPRWLRQVAESGKAIEDALVRKWYDAGYLVSAPAHLSHIHQDQYIDRKHWFTSTVDSIVCWPRDIEPLVCEVKSKDADVIEKMRRLIRGPDPKHILQVKAQIGVAHEAGPIGKLRCINSGRFAIDIAKDRVMCPLHGGDKCLVEVTLRAPTRGYIYYVSRENPADTFEFMFEYDAAFMAAGRKRLASWKQAFHDDKLPASNFDAKRFSHPLGWQWTKDPYPCKWCDWGDICRDDHRAAVEQGGRIDLTASAGVEETREIRPEYDPMRVRDAVEAFWDESPAPVA